MATVLSSGYISKASGGAMNFSPLFRFKYSYEKELAVSSPSLCAHVSSSSSASQQGHCLSNYQHISLSLLYQNSTNFGRTSFLCYPGTLFHLKSGPLSQMYKLLHVLVRKVLSEKLLWLKSGSAEVWLCFCYWFTTPLGTGTFPSVENGCWVS